MCIRDRVIPVYVWWNPYNVAMKLTGANGGVWGAYFGAVSYTHLDVYKRQPLTGFYPL